MKYRYICGFNQDERRSPIAADEFVLRRIHPSNFDAALPTSVKRCEFEPKPRDTDGLSLFQEKMIAAEQLAAAGRSPGSYYVARLAVKDLLALGLTILPTPQLSELPGHVSVPELSYDTFRADKNKSKEIQRELAILASRAIVYWPT